MENYGYPNSFNYDWFLNNSLQICNKNGNNVSHWSAQNMCILILETSHVL